MTIEEAIVNHKKLKVSAEINNDMRGAFYNAEEHEQIAGWLEELSRRRVEELFRKTNEKAIRDKAIDDVLEILKRYNVTFNCDANYEILQLKECGSND